MLRMSSSHSLKAVAVACGLSACGSPPRPEPRFKPAAPEPAPESPTAAPAASLHERSVLAISEYRCGVLLRCGMLTPGPGVIEACADVYVTKGYPELEPAVCPAIDQSRLSSCLVSIRVAECGNTFAGLASLPECAARELCAR
jgi:hypothetical protein